MIITGDEFLDLRERVIKLEKALESQVRAREILVDMALDLFTPRYVCTSGTVNHCYETANAKIAGEER